MSCCISGLLQKPYSAVDRMDRMDMITKGRPKPSLKCLEVQYDGKTLQFDPHLYKRFEWLCGSELLQAVYCWPCILFAQDRISYWTKLGYRDLIGLQKAATSHEDSIGHIRSRYMFASFVNKNMTVKVQEKIKTVQNPVTVRNHKFLRAAIDAVYLLAQTDALREQKTRQYFNINNFINILKRETTDDELMSLFLRGDGTQGQAESLQLLSDIVEAVAKALQDAVKNELKGAQFATSIVDECPDTPNQIYVGLRYINQENKLIERMLGFLKVNESDLPGGIHEYLNEVDVSEKLVAQAWGGTTCSTAAMDDAQRNIKVMSSANLFLPYDVGDLINILIQALCGIPPLKTFFAALNRIIALFNETEKIAACMNRVFLEESSGDSVNFVSYMMEMTKNPVYVIRENRTVLLEKIQYLIQSNPAELEPHILGGLAQAYAYLQDETVIVYLGVFEKMFLIVHKTITWISEASSDGFSSIKISDIISKAVTEITDVARQEWTKELLPSSVHSDISKAVTIVTSQLTLRLEELERLKFFRLFGTKNYRNYLKTFPDELMSNLISLCEKHFDRTRLKNELLVIYGTTELMDKTPPFLYYFFLEEKVLPSVFPQVYKLLQLMMSLPSYFIPVSNGKLPQRVREHTRKFVGQQRVSELAIIDVNIDLFGEVKNTQEFFNAFIDDLANKQRELEIKQEDQDESEMDVVVSIRQGLR